MNARGSGIVALGNISYSHLVSFWTLCLSWSGSKQRTASPHMQNLQDLRFRDLLILPINQIRLIRRHRGKEDAAPGQKTLFIQILPRGIVPAFLGRIDEILRIFGPERLVWGKL